MLKCILGHKMRISNEPRCRLVYTSRLTDTANNDYEINQIVAHAKVNNRSKNITGEIFWNMAMKSIVHILEGPKENVLNLYAKILNDKRHESIRLIACHENIYTSSGYKKYNSSVRQKNSVSWSNSIRNVDMKPVYQNSTPEINDFRIQSLIGSGGFATVVKATYVKTNNIVAIKIISKHKISDDHINLVTKERKVWKLLNGSPYINKLHFCLQDPANLYFVMNFSPRGDLLHFLHYHKLNYKECIFYFQEILCGLSHIHQKQIIYRDLKLENVLVNEDGHIQLTDFGLSILDADSDENHIRGTPMYLAPEVIMFKHVDMKMDIWSLGLVLLELTGCTIPWQACAKISMLKLIPEARIDYDERWDENGVNSIIKLLLTTNRVDRPTCANIIDYLLHENIIENWDIVERQELQPPIVPPIMSELSNDLLNFSV